MPRILFLFFTLLFVFNVYANDIKTESSNTNITAYKNPVLTSNDYIVALAQYKLGNYTTSYSQFQKLFLQYNDSVEVNFYLAMNAVELKLYDDATAAFERVLIVQPEYHRARLEYARVLFILGFKEESKSEFLKVAQYPVPQNVRENINKYLQQIDNTTDSSTFIALSFGWMHDNNINSGIDRSTYDLPGFGLTVNGEKPQSSSAYVTTVQLNHIHSLFKDSPFILKHTGFAYYKNQTENDKYNFNFYSYKPTLYYNNAKNKEEYSLQLGIDQVMPGDNNDFTAYSISPVYKKLLNKESIFTVFATHKDIAYENLSNESKDYRKNGAGFSMEYKKLTYTLNFEEDNKIRGTRTDIDKHIVENSLGYSYDIMSTLILNTQYQHSKITYDQEDVFFANTREDINRNFYLGLTKIVSESDYITLSYTNTDNSSNQTAYDYDKETVMLNYTWRFKLWKSLF